MMLDVIKSNPLLFFGTVALPFITGVGGACVGYLNLVNKTATDAQNNRIEEGVKQIATNDQSVAASLGLMESYRDELAKSGQRDAILSALIEQYARLSRTSQLFHGLITDQDKLTISAEVLKTFQQIIPARIRDDLPGRPLVIPLDPNTFRVIYPVPMRIAPQITITNLPEGVTAHVTDVTTVAFNVSFSPNNIPITNFGIVASADF